MIVTNIQDEFICYECGSTMSDGLLITLKWHDETSFYICFTCFSKFRKIQEESAKNNYYRDYDFTEF